MGLTVLFSTIHRSHGIISINFYFYLQYFHQKVFSFNKINGFQMDLKRRKNKNKRGQVVNIGWLNMESGMGKLEVSFTIFLQQIIGGKLLLILI